MATWSETEELRIEAIEEAINDLQTAMNNTPTKRQLKELLLIRQNEIEDLKTRVTELESEIQILQGS